jgi:hypothetical protein
MKKIAVNTVKTFLKENKSEDAYTKTFTVGESSFEVTFHTALTVAEKSVFVNRVVSGCFDAAGKFRPEYVSPMLRATILQVCTNLPVLTLKGEQAEDGGSLMDVEAMNDLYGALDLDHLDNISYQVMMNEMVQLTWQAIEWRKSRILAHDSAPKLDSIDEAAQAIKAAAEGISKSVESADLSTLMEYAGQLSQATKGLDEGGILNGLLTAHQNMK